MGIDEATVVRALLYAIDAAVSAKDYTAVDYFTKAYQRIKSANN